MGGEFNMCYNCVDRHVDEGHGDKTALIWESPVSQSPPNYMSYNTLQDKVSLSWFCIPYIISGEDLVLTCS